MNFRKMSTTVHMYAASGMLMETTIISQYYCTLDIRVVVFVFTLDKQFANELYERTILFVFDFIMTKYNESNLF